MRLQISCENTIAVTIDILKVLESRNVDPQCIEFNKLENQLNLSISSINIEQNTKVLSDIQAIDAVTSVSLIQSLVHENKYNQLEAILKVLPDGVISIDIYGNIMTANQSALLDLNSVEQYLLGKPLQSVLKGFNFSHWLTSSDVAGQTLKLTTNNEEFVSDIWPIKVLDETGEFKLVGAVVNLKSHVRLGQQIKAFRDVNNGSFIDVVAKSPSMRRVLSEAKKMSQLEAPLLIQGETGTGKEVLARACHDASERSILPFLVLNCASLPDDVAESELFGYGPNAYPGSDEDGKRGVFELAEGGTVFLDEVGEMSPELQTKLLRFLQDGTFRRVADENEVKIDVRVICSTQKDLAQMVQEKTFREDLYYRLNVLSIEIPALRKRKQDILPLTQHFVHAFSNEVGKESPSLSKDCMEYIQKYPWPGNTRQLENAVYRAISLLDSDIIEKDMLGLPTYSNEFGYLETEFEGSLEEAVKRFEAGVLRKYFPAYPSSRQLAKQLGLSHTAIAKKLKEYGINKDSLDI